MANRELGKIRGLIAAGITRRMTMRRLLVPPGRRPLMAMAVFVVVLSVGASAQATFPGKNGRIAFASTRSGNLEIYTMRPDGTGVRRLTHSRHIESTHPDWSPDGKWIVFERVHHRGSTETLHVHLMRADGSGLRRLTGAGLNGDPAFSPNGRRIVFWHSRENTLPNLYTMKRDGSDWRRITRTPRTAEAFAQYSPDGKWIAYTAFRLSGAGKPPAVFIVGANGGTPRQVTPDWLHGGAADWSPDGRRLVFSNNLDLPHSSIFTIRADGTGIRRLTRGPRFVDEFDASYSPDGRRITFVGDRLGEERFDAWVMNTDGTNLRRLTPTRHAFEFSTDWGPRH